MGVANDCGSCISKLEGPGQTGRLGRYDLITEQGSKSYLPKLGTENSKKIFSQCNVAPDIILIATNNVHAFPYTN